MPKSGHLPGHYRDTFLAAVDAYLGWNDGEPEPTVEYEIRWVPREISISRACGLVWSCTDIMPGDVFDQIRDCGLAPQRRTYAACSRVMLASIKGTISKAA